MLLSEVLIVLFLILLNGFFAMSELAVISSRRVRLQAMADEGNRGAAIALGLLADSSRFLSSVQIGITLVGILAGAFSGATVAVRLGEFLALQYPAIAPYAGQLAFALVVVLITYLTLIAGELVPKQLALGNAERIAARVARPMAWVAMIAAPAVHLLDLSTRFWLRLLRRGEQPDQTVTEEEIRMLISEATAAGVVEHAEESMLTGVMRLAELPVDALMTPRPDIVWLDLEDGLEANLAKLRESAYSRLPVAEGELDEVLGVVQAKDLLDETLAGRPMDLRASVREAVMVPEGIPALQVLDLLKQSTIHLALVVDEYGGIQGLLTATDLLEAIVGNLTDIEGGELPEAMQREDGSWLMDGSVAVDRAKDMLGLRALPEERDYHTLAGFILSQMTHVPDAGEVMEWGGYRFEVVDMDGHRIDKVLIVPLPRIQDNDSAT